MTLRKELLNMKNDIGNDVGVQHGKLHNLAPDVWEYAGQRFINKYYVVKQRYNLNLFLQYRVPLCQVLFAKVKTSHFQHKYSLFDKRNTMGIFY